MAIYGHDAHQANQNFALALARTGVSNVLSRASWISRRASNTALSATIAKPGYISLECYLASLTMSVIVTNATA